MNSLRPMMMVSGIFGGKFTTKENAETLMKKLGYNSYTVTSNNNILFNPRKVPEDKAPSEFFRLGGVFA